MTYFSPSLIQAYVSSINSFDLITAELEPLRDFKAASKVCALPLLNTIMGAQSALTFSTEKIGD